MTAGRYTEFKPKDQDLANDFKKVQAVVKELFLSRDSDMIDRRIAEIRSRLMRDDMTFEDVLEAGQYSLAVKELRSEGHSIPARWKKHALISRFGEIAAQVLERYTQQQIRGF